MRDLVDIEASCMGFFWGGGLFFYFFWGGYQLFIGSIICRYNIT